MDKENWLKLDIAANEHFARWIIMETTSSNDISVCANMETAFACWHTLFHPAVTRNIFPAWWKGVCLREEKEIGALLQTGA